MLDRVAILICDIRGLWSLQHLVEGLSVQTIDQRVDLGQIWRVVSLEGLDLLVCDLLDLVLRHKSSALNALKWIKLTLLLYHELVNRMNENESIIARRHQKALIIGELGR